jgi:hypothetical protein
MKIYVASSWRNNLQPEIVDHLRNDGHEVYDFKNPGPGNVGFQWSFIDEKWQTWTNDEYVSALNHPVAQHGFDLDFDAMKWADICVLVMPCGRSAHTEAGWMKGAGKPTIALINTGEPELMYKIFDHIACSVTELLAMCNSLKDNIRINKSTFPECKINGKCDGICALCYDLLG